MIYKNVCISSLSSQTSAYQAYISDTPALLDLSDGVARFACCSVKRGIVGLRLSKLLSLNTATQLALLCREKDQDY